jgi:type 1 fimbria pilin
MNGNSAGCDAPVGKLTSPAFQVTQDHLNLLMHGGGAGGVGVGLRLLDTLGNELHTYQPETCGPSRITNDDDWTGINMTALKGAFVKAQLFDEQSGGCGFVSTDHWYQAQARWNPSGNGKDGGTVVLNATKEAKLGYNVMVDAESFAQVIGDFDDAQATAGVWVATGDFANPANADSWKGVSGVARIGSRAVSTCELNANAKGCDGPTGTLTSPLFTVSADRPVLRFLMSGGDQGAKDVGLRVLDSAGNEVSGAIHKPSSCNQAQIRGEENWVRIDLTNKIGSQVKVQVFDNETGGCGFVSFDHIHMTK